MSCRAAALDVGFDRPGLEQRFVRRRRDDLRNAHCATGHTTVADELTTAADSTVGGVA
jgi:hypothetical protein